MSQCSVRGYELQDWGSIPSRIIEFLFCHYVHIDFRVQPALYPVDTDGCFHVGKVARVQSWLMSSE